MPPKISFCGARAHFHAPSPHHKAPWGPTYQKQWVFLLIRRRACAPAVPECSFLMSVFQFMVFVIFNFLRKGKGAPRPSRVEWSPPTEPPRRTHVLINAVLNLVSIDPGSILSPPTCLANPPTCRRVRGVVGFACSFRFRIRPAFRFHLIPSLPLSLSFSLSVVYTTSFSFRVVTRAE